MLAYSNDSQHIRLRLNIFEIFSAQNRPKLERSNFAQQTELVIIIPVIHADRKTHWVIVNFGKLKDLSDSLSLLIYSLHTGSGFKQNIHIYSVIIIS